MRIFDFTGKGKEKSVLRLVEENKSILISNLGKRYENSICSILDDANYVLAPADAMMDEGLFERYFMGELKKLGLSANQQTLEDLVDILGNFDFKTIAHDLEHSEQTVPEEYEQFVGFYNDHVRQGGEDGDEEQALKFFIDNFKALAKIAIVYFASKDNPSDFYGSRYSLYKFTQNEVVDQFWGSTNLSLENRLVLQSALENDESFRVHRLLNISEAEAQLAIDTFNAAFEDIEKLSKAARRNLRNILKKSELMQYINEQLIQNDQVKDKDIGIILELFGSYLFEEDRFVAFTIAANNFDSLASRNFCALKVSNAKATQIHEMLHLVSTKIVHDPMKKTDEYVSKCGFCTLNKDGDDMGSSFNEFFTEYLTINIMKNEFPNKVKLTDSIYDSQVAFYAEFFDKHKDVLLSSYMGWNMSDIFAAFGKENVKQAFAAADRFYDLAENLSVKTIDNIRGLLDENTSPEEKARLEKILSRNPMNKKCIEAAKKVKTSIENMSQYNEYMVGAQKK